MSENKKMTLRNYFTSTAAASLVDKGTYTVPQYICRARALDSSASCSSNWKNMILILIVFVGTYLLMLSYSMKVEAK